MLLHVVLESVPTVVRLDVSLELLQEPLPERLGIFLSRGCYSRYTALTILAGNLTRAVKPYSRHFAGI
jgi:hypothetical protein